jgi:hypothetical protein
VIKLSFSKKRRKDTKEKWSQTISYSLIEGISGSKVTKKAAQKQKK